MATAHCSIRTKFIYQPNTDISRPAEKTVRRKQLHRKDRAVIYQAQASDCGGCPLKSRCAEAAQRTLIRHLDEDALNRMHQRATPALMRLRRCTAERHLSTLKYCIFRHPRFLLRGLRGAHTEISLAVMAYNLNVWSTPSAH